MRSLVRESIHQIEYQKIVLLGHSAGTIRTAPDTKTPLRENPAACCGPVIKEYESNDPNSFSRVCVSSYRTKKYFTVWSCDVPKKF